MDTFFYRHLCLLCVLAIIGCTKRSEDPKGSVAIDPKIEPSPAKQYSKAMNKTFPIKQQRSVLEKYHGNVKTRSLHGPGCPHYECSNCKMGFKTIKEGIISGYRPHKCIRKNNKKKRGRGGV